MTVAGFGCRASATRASLLSAYQNAGGQADRLAAPRDKCASPALVALARALGLPLVAIDDTAMQAAQTLSQSPASVAARATGSVAEACALVAAGPGAQLLAPRAISDDRRATCALAQGAPS
ncbi:MAG: cobalamin biosynthesis protein [Sedimentitalea sp.]